ncbi:uncharacterized protein BDW70DRAFT_116286 [Aspergillus foveolatus]|uniref:uncharacterized protein n=1 Tax=Aspergillus foveolatus TaxID=210207 RepID=UPI003CCC98FB
MGLREPHALPSRQYPFLYHEGTSSAGVLGIHTQRPTCFDGSRPWLDYHRSTSTPIFPYCSPFPSAAFSMLFSSISLFLFFLFSFPSLSFYFLLVLSFPFFPSHLHFVCSFYVVSACTILGLPFICTSLRSGIRYLTTADEDRNVEKRRSRPPGVIR